MSIPVWEVYLKQYSQRFGLDEEHKKYLRQMVDAAIADEREACIRIIRKHDDTCGTHECHTLTLEEAIMARKEK